MPRLILLAALVLALALCWWPPAAAGSLQVAPLALQLSADRTIETLRVRNTGGERVLVQIDAYDWTLAAGDERQTPTRSLLAIPPLFQIEPGLEQLVRIGFAAPPAAADTEQAFRILISEIPREAPRGSSVLRLPLRVSLPVFLAPAAPAPRDERAVSFEPLHGDGRWQAVRAVNDRATHIKIVGLELLGGDARRIAHQALLGYVLGRTRREFALPAPARPAQPAALRITYLERGVQKQITVDLDRLGPVRATAAG